MAEHDTLQAKSEDAAARVGSANLVVGLLDCQGGAALDNFVAALEPLAAALTGVTRTVVAYAGDDAGVGAGTGAEGEVADARTPGAGVVALPFPALAAVQDPSGAGAEAAQRAIFALARSVGASACVVLAMGGDRVDPRLVIRLASPLLARGLDLVIPCHARPRLGGLINNALVYPLVRTLYGKRVRCLVGSDFAVSSRLAERRLRSEGVPGAARAIGTLDALVCDAVVAGLQVGQAHAGPWRPPSRDGIDLSSVLARVLGPLFLDMERHAAFWQKVRVSMPVETFGQAEAVADDGPEVNVTDMIHSCQIGCRNLQEVWGAVLPPATLLELRKLGRATEDAFLMPDELWVRIVFDFALGHRMRAINRDHLLRSLTPLYLGWVASFVGEVSHQPADAVERRVERLCLTYEREKRYLLSRWRWPDRFNP
jgi:glucosylglycerate synthase